MIVGGADLTASSIAAAIGEPARARMLYSLMDGRARTSTELAMVADVSPSTASVHLKRLESRRLVRSVAQGKHRYYQLAGTPVAAALEALSVVAGGSRNPFEPSTPDRLRVARTCYDHIAGILGVGIHDQLTALHWLSASAEARDALVLTESGVKALESLGVDVEATRLARRRFAYACLDWSERRPHIAGALGSALLQIAQKKKWVIQELDCRALRMTTTGRMEFRTRLGLVIHN